MGDVELAVRVGEDGPGLRVDWSVRNPGRADVRLAAIGVGIEAARPPELVMEHGWQSWSVVRPCRPDDVRPERRDVPEWRRAMYFADVGRAGRSVVGDQFLLTDGGVAGFLDGRRHLSVVDASPLTAWALLDGVALGRREERVLEPLWLAAGDPGRLYSEYARRWGDQAGARAATPAPSGWCSWYHYFSSVTPADVRANLARAEAHGLEVVQVDDGWQAAIGEWLTTRPSWAEGTAAVAADILAAGLTPGIWTAPFLVDERTRLVGDHPDWVLGRAMHNPVWWGGWALALDTTNPAVLDHVTPTLAALTAQGFGYHKVDFLYAAAMSGCGRGRVTRAEALRAGLEAVRRGVGDDAFLLGCGSPFGPAVGVVDAMRVSPDVTDRWEPRAVLPGLEEAASCARNAVATSRLRAPLHRRLWINDGDCLLLRPVQTELDATQRRTLARAVVRRRRVRLRVRRPVSLRRRRVGAAGRRPLGGGGGGPSAGPRRPLRPAPPMIPAAVRRLDCVVPENARAEVVLLRDGAELASWPLICPGGPDLAIVDELARMQLAARQLGCTIWLRRACPELAGLLDLAGLAGVVPCEPQPPDAA